jgi:hypothetical protein
VEPAPSPGEGIEEAADEPVAAETAPDQ